LPCRRTAFKPRDLNRQGIQPAQMVMPDRIFSGRPPNSMSQDVGGAEMDIASRKFGIGNA
jgi:hypothetical protein